MEAPLELEFDRSRQKALNKRFVDIGLHGKAPEKNKVLKVLRKAYDYVGAPVSLRSPRQRNKLKKAIRDRTDELPQSVLDGNENEEQLQHNLYKIVQAIHAAWHPDLQVKKVPKPTPAPKQAPPLASPPSFFATVPMVFPNIDLQVVRASNVKQSVPFRLSDFMEQGSGAKSFSSDMNWIDGSKVRYSLLWDALNDAALIQYDDDTLWLSPWPLYCVKLPDGPEYAEEGEVRLTESNFISCIRRMIDEKFPRLRIEDVMQDHAGPITRPNFTIIIRPKNAIGGALQPSNDRTLSLPSSYDKSGSWPKKVTLPVVDRDRLSRPRHERAGKLPGPKIPLVGHRHGKKIKQAAPPSSAGKKAILGGLEPVQFQRRRPALATDEGIQSSAKRQRQYGMTEWPRISRVRRLAMGLKDLSSGNKNTKDGGHFLNLCQDIITEIEEIEKSPDLHGHHKVEVHENYFEIVSHFLEEVFHRLQTKSGLSNDALIYAKRMGSELTDLIAPRSLEEADIPHTIKMGDVVLHNIVGYLERLDDHGKDEEVNQIESQFFLDIGMSTLDNIMQFSEEGPSPRGYLPVLELMSCILEEIAQQIREQKPLQNIAPVFEIATFLEIILEENQDDDGYFLDEVLTMILQPASDLMEVQGLRMNPGVEQEDSGDKTELDPRVLSLDVAGILFDAYDLRTEKGTKSAPSNDISKIFRAIFEKFSKSVDLEIYKPEGIPPLLSLLFLASEVFARLQDVDMRERGLEINPGSVGSFLHICLIVYLHMLRSLGQGDMHQRNDAKILYDFPSWAIPLVREVIEEAKFNDARIESKTPVRELVYFLEMIELYQKSSEVPPWSQFSKTKFETSMTPFYANVYTEEELEEKPLNERDIPDGEAIDDLCTEVIADYSFSRMGVNEMEVDSEQKLRMPELQGHFYKTIRTLIKNLRDDNNDDDEEEDGEVNEEEYDSDTASNASKTSSNSSSSSGSTTSRSSDTSSGSGDSDSSSDGEEGEDTVPQLDSGDEADDTSDDEDVEMSGISDVASDDSDKPDRSSDNSPNESQDESSDSE